MAEVQPDLVIYRLMTPEDFTAFEAEGRFEGTAHDRRDGFIHFSRGTQVRETAARHYADVDPLVLVEVETAPLIDFIRWEESRGGELFPHLYGVLDWESVRRHWVVEGGEWPEL